MPSQKSIAMETTKTHNVLKISMLKNLRTKFSKKIGYSLTLLNKINITIYFENLTVKLHVLYTHNTHIKFCVNRILFTI